jgi:hypothetical protein
VGSSRSAIGAGPRPNYIPNEKLIFSVWDHAGTPGTGPPVRT